MHLEIIILNEGKSEEDKYNTTYTWSWKYDANGFIYKTETHSDIEKQTWSPKGKG